MANSDNQLTRILSIALVLGGLLFIFSAEMSDLKSKKEITTDETIYIQDGGAISVQGDEELIEKTEEVVSTNEVVSTDIDIPQAEQDIENNNWANTTADNIEYTKPLDFEHITLLVANMNANERERILADQNLFKQVIESEANNRSTLMSAASNQLNQHPNVKFMMERNADNMLLEFYLNLLIKRKLPEEFPSNEQIIAYYESNKETQFTLPLRARIWQIFLSKPKDVSETEILELQQKAEEIVSKIKKGTNDFSNLAVSQSQHEQSKSRGGYMGVMEVDGLLPEIKEHILKSKVGEVSDPIETDSGLHIIKRGTILAEETIVFEQVEDQIRQILIKQTGMQLKNAIFDQARKDYPQQISESIIEDWWLKLKDEINP
jgi:parvulin-like peptidyl-prolyl isomerase